MIEDMQHLQGRGLVGQVKGDFHAAMQHKDEVVTGIRNNFPVWLRRLGVDIFTGNARFLEPYQIEVEAPESMSQDSGHHQPRLTAKKIIIATGSAPKEFSACPFDGKIVISSREFMFELAQLPASMLFIGGGTIGVELAYLMHQFGSQVRLVEQEDRLLPNTRIPDHAGATLERKFKRIGLDYRVNTTVTHCETADGKAHITFSDGSQASFDKVLVAVGRSPVVTGLDLEKTGVALNEDGFIITSEYLETNVPGIYAIGDVKPGPMTANAALHDAKVAAANAVEGNQLVFNYFKVPVVINSAMEIAAVGLTEDQAEAAGFTPESARTSFGGSGKARAYHDTEGFVEVIHDA
jgi:dihydrolipoamide dehydrogenase